jgi:hypothetical protein
MLKLTIYLTLLWTPVAALGQQPPAAPSSQGSAATRPAQPEEKKLPEAQPGDVDSIEHIAAALYDVVSGPAGGRDWDRMRSLFYKDAHMIPSGRTKEGAIWTRVYPIDDFIARTVAVLAKQGYYERAIVSRVDHFDHLAQVWSTYETRAVKASEKPDSRGVNSMHLFFDGKRWYILDLYWQSEDPAQPLPPELLPH